VPGNQKQPVLAIMSKRIAIIPARYDSKRFPGKALALISGKPMIQHVYERAIRCKELDEVYIATDDERIFRCAKGFGAEVILTWKGHRTGTERVFEAAERLGLKDEDIVINIQGDQPAFNPAIISILIEGLKESDVATLKYPIKGDEILDPNIVKVVTDKEGFALYFSRAPIPYVRDKKEGFFYKHLGFYGYRMGFLKKFINLPEGVLERLEKLEQLRVLENGYKIKVIESPYDSVDVNVPEDVKKAEDAISSLKEPF